MAVLAFIFYSMLGISTKTGKMFISYLMVYVKALKVCSEQWRS